MKKLLALLAVVLCVVSCQTEPEGLDVNVGGEIDAIVNVTIPEAETRAANSGIGVFNNGVLDGNATMRYILQVYYKTVENGEAKYTASAERKVEYSDGKSVAFDVRLVPDRDYKFVVWADVVASEADVDNHYVTKDVDGKSTLDNITLNGDWNAMDESRDAFTATELIEKFNGAKAINITLKRPFAKLRVVTTDMEALSNINITPYKATATYTTSHRVAFNALTGKAASASLEDKAHTYTITTYANEWDNNGDSMGTMTIFSDYFFAADDDIVKFNLNVYEENGNLIKPNAFQTDINVKPNYLTTIKGNILTDGKNVTVEVEDAFDGYYAVPSEVSELVNVINSAADGVETIIPVNEDIELPEALTIPAGKNIVLDFAANTTLTGTLVVEDGAELTVNNGTIENTDKSFSGITSNGKLTLNNVEIKSARHAVRVESGEVVIYSGTFEVDPVSASTLHALNVGDDGKSATVIIKGGTFRGPKGTMADSGSAVNVRNGSTVIIEGGSFSGGKNKTLSAAAGATLIVKGGFFDQDPSAFVETDYTTINMDPTGSAAKEYVYAVMKGSENNGSYNILIEDTAALEFLADVVDYEYTFAGDVVNLEGDIYLEGETWNPIGDNRKDYAAFSGTFDGHNHTISGAKITGDSCFNGAVYGSKEGWGLFSVLDGATVKNVKLDDEVFASYTVISGAVAGYAYDTTFENIDITNTKIAGYNWYTGGVVGWAAGNCTFKGINLDSSVVVGTLWDSHGQNAGGIAGGVSGTGTYTIEDCNIACVMDVINDVTSNYKWYIYRVSGMIIGNTNTTETKYNEVVTATATNVTCKNVTVTYGDWMNYHYCEGYWNRGWGRYESSDYVGGVDQNEPHNHAAGEKHLVTIPFDQLFGGSANGSGHYPVRGLREFEGVTVNYPASYVRGVSNYDELKKAITAGISQIALENDIEVDEWVMISEDYNIGTGDLITIDEINVTIDGNGKTLIINSIESAGNGDQLFQGASVLNISNLTIKYADGLTTGGLGMHSGVIKNVHFVGGGSSAASAAIFPKSGEIKVEDCIFDTNGAAFYFDDECDNLTVTRCTFNQKDNKNVILLRGDVKFTDNVINSGRTVNVVSGSPVVTGNNFNNVRFKVYGAATATISNNIINNLEFDGTTYASTFTNNTLSAAAQAALDAATKVN